MSVLHARLRNKCSGLNSDLFRNHIRNNRLCDLCLNVVFVCLLHYSFIYCYLFISMYFVQFILFSLNLFTPSYVFVHV